LIPSCITHLLQMVLLVLHISAALQLLIVALMVMNGTQQQNLAMRNAHVKVAATTTAVMNLITSSTKPSKRCILIPMVMTSIPSMLTGSVISTPGGTTETSPHHHERYLVNELT